MSCRHFLAYEGHHGLLLGGSVPRRASVRPQAGAALGAFLRGPDGRVWNTAVVVLDPSANSWMQTPAGYEIIDGRFFPKDWLQIIFNPSFPYRLAHTVVAFYVTTAFVVVAVAAYLIRGGRFAEEGRVMFSMTFWLLSVLVPLQILLGDLHGSKHACVSASKSRCDRIALGNGESGAAHTFRHSGSRPMRLIATRSKSQCSEASSWLTILMQS